MTDLLAMARKKADALANKTEEISEIIDSAENFFSSIENYRDLLTEDLDDYDDFLTNGSIIVQTLQTLNKKNLEELVKIGEFIEFGEMLIKTEGNFSL